MSKKDRKKQFDIPLLAIRTCQWCNIVLFQAERFLAVVEKTNGSLPWEEHDSSSLFQADRFFLIMAIKNAMIYMKDLHDALHEKDDDSINSIFKMFENDENYRKLNDLRDINVHGDEYISSAGMFPERFIKYISKGSITYQTNPLWTVIDGKEDLLMFGDVDIKNFLFVFKEKMPSIKEITEKIFYKYII